MANLFDTKDHTAEFDKADIKENKVMGIFAYISWLVLVPMFAAKDSKWARFHANNGIILAAAELAVWILFGLLGMIPYVGWFFWALNIISTLGLLALAVIGIINAASGKAKNLPLIGLLSEKIKILK